jgi:hypothetical protein
VARSTTPGGRCVALRHGEALDFSENGAVVVVAGATATTARSSSSSKRRRREDATVRFRSSSLVRGALRPGLSSILSPLLRFRGGGGGERGAARRRPPLVSMEGKALMEMRHLVMGCEVPIELTVYVDDPDGFFGLFGRGDSRHEDDDDDEDDYDDDVDGGLRGGRRKRGRTERVVAAGAANRLLR